ncbi:hypothetical protein [Agrobacterium rosae]|uniref:hypothetical protein n=1 Tax=Agrobacterium rosae TaxID=1972867 RepID=UPI003BA293F1
MNDRDWEDLLEAVDQFQELFPEGLVFIGGIAVFAYAKSKEETAAFAAQSHDADFMILRSDFIELRDITMMTVNKRLSKHQFVEAGFEFDVYVEGQTDLAVPVDEAVANSEFRSGLRVACIEHLLILKAKALEDRKGTSKGNKDEDDMVRILLVAEEIDRERLSRLTEDALTEIRRAVDGDAPLRLARGNSHLARNLRNKARERLDDIINVFSHSIGDPET